MASEAMTVEAEAHRIRSRSQVADVETTPSLTPNKPDWLTRLKHPLTITLSTIIATTALLGQPKPAGDASAQGADSNTGVGPIPPSGEVYKPPAGETKAVTAEGIVKEIQDKYGVTIPEPSDTYSQENGDANKTLTPNIVPSIEQLDIIEEDLSLLPDPEYLAPLLICFRNTDAQAVAGGAELGYQWDAFLHPSHYPGILNNFPYDRLTSDKSAIELFIPDANSSDPLPQKTNDTANLPPVLQIAIDTSKVKVNTQEQVPWTDQGERLEQTVIHEYFHAIDEKFSLANSKDATDFWSKQAFFIYDMSSWDITNPLYTTFAKLTGWKLMSEVEIMKEYDPEAAAKSTKDPVVNSTFFWQRDPKVWGDLAHRKNRLTIYASYGPIQETIAEYWMAYKLYPNLLTPQERSYFQKIDEGLRSPDPQKFVDEVVKNPGLLLVYVPPVPQNPRAQ